MKEKEGIELAEKMLKLKTRDESLNVDSSTIELLATFAKHGNRIAHEALIHLCILATPEDYDDDICD